MSEAQADIGTAGLRLTCFDRFPDELLQVPAWRLWQYLEGPSLFRIAGRRPEPLFVSVLLHGTEHTGWEAVQAVLERHARTQLPRALLLFVANIVAAKANVHTLPTQIDYNRTWPGTTHLTAPRTSLMKEVFEIVSREAPYASIDIHNNTGNNPALRLRYKSQRQRSASSASFQPYHRPFQKIGGCTGGSTRRNLPGGHDRMRPHRLGGRCGGGARHIAPARSSCPSKRCRSPADLRHYQFSERSERVV